MRAYVVPSAGESPVLQEIDIPQPEPGEVRVRVTAASVNSFDVLVAAGEMDDYFDLRYPLVLGREFTGFIDALGEGVDGVSIGDRVIGVVAKPYFQEGAFAEYTTALVANGIAHAPASLTDAAAAALAHTGSTALVALDALGDPEGNTVLVVGATGGVGTLLVQLASTLGAKVIATARTDEGRALLSELGATWTVDYADLDAEVRAIAPNGVDAAVHLMGDVGQIAALVRDHGLLVSTVLVTPDGVPGADRIEVVPVASISSGAGLHKLADLVDGGQLDVIVDRAKPFDEIDAAFAEYGHETLGNIVVIVSE